MSNPQKENEILAKKSAAAGTNPADSKRNGKGRRMGDYPRNCPECGNGLVVHTRDADQYWEVWCPNCNFKLNSWGYAD